MSTTLSPRLVRSRDERWFGGVCGGLAERFEVDPALVRLVAVVATLLGLGSIVLVYLAAWLLVPLED
ncbi:MAG: PspC domain-containing protein [Nocardioidaceae bacterium]|nr:PspC domain-containing protein [Nocardioidaceae bacterium]